MSLLMSNPIPHLRRGLCPASHLLHVRSMAPRCALLTAPRNTPPAAPLCALPTAPRVAHSAHPHAAEFSQNLPGFTVLPALRLRSFFRSSRSQRSLKGMVPFLVAVLKRAQQESLACGCVRLSNHFASPLIFVGRNRLTSRTQRR